MTTCSIPTAKNKIHRTSEKAAARINVPRETLGATDFAARPTAKCPTNTLHSSVQLFRITATYYRNHKKRRATSSSPILMFFRWVPSLVVVFEDWDGPPTFRSISEMSGVAADHQLFLTG
jgi:hypothetical protein